MQMYHPPAWCLGPETEAQLGNVYYPVCMRKGVEVIGSVVVVVNTKSLHLEFQASQRVAIVVKISKSNMLLNANHTCSCMCACRVLFGLHMLKVDIGYKEI